MRFVRLVRAKSERVEFVVCDEEYFSVVSNDGTVFVAKDI